MAPSRTVMSPDAPHRCHELREVGNAVRWIGWAGAPWRLRPTTCPPWRAVPQPTQRGSKTGCVAAMAHDLRATLRWAEGRADAPTSALFARATRPSSPERGRRVGSAGATRRRGSQGQAAVDPLGHRLTLHVPGADAPDREQVGALAAAVHAATGQTGAVAFVDQGDTGDTAVAEEHGIRLEVITLEDAKRGFVLLPRRWVVARACAWATRFRRLVRDDERLPETVAGVHVLACVTLMLHRLVAIVAQSP